jgi:tRNA uridine 5-carboxymethylaminomethyl modification enzyme
MSCNPAVGGIAKGQNVREIDALGGQMGVVTIALLFNFVCLIVLKVRQCGASLPSDRHQFILQWIKTLTNTPNLYIWQDTVKQILIGKGKLQVF